MLLVLPVITPGTAHAAVDAVNDTDFVQVAAGYAHTVALKADGTVWTWGYDNLGQLGDDVALANKSTPVQVPGLTGVRQVAAGYGHTVAVKADGTVWAWGWDAYGQLGDNASLTNQPTPVQVAGSSNVRQVAAGTGHTVAVRADGTAWSWGWDGYGQLGDNASLTNQPTPVQVSGLVNARQVAAGNGQSLAVRADGTAWSWGQDSAGQLGNNVALVNQPTPVQVAGLTNVRQVAAGWFHSLAVRADGTAWSWGSDATGQLGNDAALTNQPTPVQVSGLTNARYLAASAGHTIAVRADGTAWSWGDDSYGQLGDDAALVNQPTPVQVASLTNARQVAAGSRHMITMMADGTVRSWGWDLYGQLGDDAALVDKAMPVAVVWTVECAFIQVEAGTNHTIALRADGTVWTWGEDIYGQLGDDATLASKSTPVQVLGLAEVRQVDAGAYHSIALKADGTVWTWGGDSAGQLGDDTATVSKPTPVMVVGLTNATQVSAGDSHSVSVRANGAVWTWGSDFYGQLGNDAALVNQPTPVLVAGLTNARQVAAGRGHTVAVEADGTASTWGLDGQGQLGNNVALTNQPTPVSVSGLTNARQITAGYSHTIAVRGDGTGWSWGDDWAGQLGNDAALTNQPTPVQVSGLTNTRQVEGGNYHSIATRADGTAWTWGLDSWGQLGDDAALANMPTPVPVAGLTNIRQATGGGLHTIALAAGGTLWTWGRDTSGQLGDDVALANQPLAVAVASTCSTDTTPPTPNPSTGAGTASSTSQIQWLMDSASDPSGLHATPYSFNGGSSWQLDKYLNETGLSANTQYSKTIQARDSLDNRTTGTLISRYTFTNPPTAPTSAGGWSSGSGYNVALGWTAPAVGGAASYNVRWSVDAYAAILGNPAGLLYTHTLLAANTSYTFKICSVNGDGVEEATCTGTTSATTPPAAPTAFTTSNHTDTQVDVAWTAAAGQTNQRLQIFSDAGCTTSVSNTTGVTSPRTVTGLSLDRFYWYQLSSFSATSATWGAPTTCTALSGNGRTSITIALNAANVNLGTLIPGDTATGSSTVTTTTYGSTGYNLLASIDGPPTSGGNTVPHTTSGTIGSPPGASAGPWVGNGFGITVSNAVNLEAGWSNGTRWAALSTTPTNIHSTGATFTANTANATDTTISYRAIVPPAQPPGTYTATITYTAVATP